MKELEINVEGMNCDHCKMAVESELKEVVGVSNAEVNLEAKNVKVNLEDESLSLNKLYNAIEEAGFEPIKS
jgi:copper chaperone CopZ